MVQKLELVREEKLHRLLPGKKKDSRLEASGVALVDERTAAVVCDNLNQVALVDLSLERSESNRLLPAPGLGEGFEDIAIDRQAGHVFCLVEAVEEVDGRFRGFVSEYGPDFKLIRCTRLPVVLAKENKGFEGLVHARVGGEERLYALREGKVAGDERGRIEVFARARDQGWEHSHGIDLPGTKALEDFAGVEYRDGRVAVVSQASARLWVAELDDGARALVPGSETLYRFPGKGYCNVEGIAWLSADTLVAVSDRKKKRQPGRCSDKDQSIHVFRIPGR